MSAVVVVEEGGVGRADRVLVSGVDGSEKEKNPRVKYYLGWSAKARLAACVKSRTDIFSLVFFLFLFSSRTFIHTHQTNHR